MYATAWQVQLFDILVFIAIVLMITCFTILYLSQRRENLLLREQNDLLRKERLGDQPAPVNPLPMPTIPPQESHIPSRVAKFVQDLDADLDWGDELLKDVEETTLDPEKAVQFVEDFFKPQADK